MSKRRSKAGATTPPHPAAPIGTMHLRWCGILFFISGSAALIYQVLWVRALGLLLGGTAQAAALTVAIFFAGLAAGGAWWGRRAARMRDPLRIFGGLEVGVAFTALAFFALIALYRTSYPALHAMAGHRPALDLLLKIFVAATVLFPSAFLMGGTLPMMGEHVIRAEHELGRKGSWLYALNTLGGATGALAAGFALPVWLGFRGAYLLAIGLDMAVGLAALETARRHGRREGHHRAAARPLKTLQAPPPESEPSDRLPPGLIWMLAFVSGCAALGIEIIWTRLFAQVLQNSVYTYALVLVAFLTALAIGAGFANLGCRVTSVPPARMIMVLLGLAGIATAVSPLLFYTITGGMGYVGTGKDWYAYLRSVIGAVTLVMLVPGAVIGAVLPYLLRVLQSWKASPGQTIGRLIAVNTTGAITGALGTGFVLLPWLGATRAIWALAAVYFSVAAVVCAVQSTRPHVRAFAAILALAAFLLPAVPPTWMQVVRLQPGRNEVLVDWIEGLHTTAAVIERDGHLLIRVNNHYTLGGTGALESERNQTFIPMMLHPAPKRVFFLGMGTGISAGAALHFPDVEKVVVTEILPEVIQLARAHFQPWTPGLFSDPRVTILAEDGRNVLARSPQRYDLIISDLFTPWEAGTGNLYTLEHYKTAAQRLAPGGLFVQWIPAYQVSRKEFGMIARTMDEVFEQVLLWRGDLLPTQSILALVGQNKAEPLDPSVPATRGRHLAPRTDMPAAWLKASVLRFYAGNITASGLFRNDPLNTDNFPRIEYQAPRTQRAVQAGRERWLTGDQLGILYEQMLRAPGLTSDPYLAKIEGRHVGYILAGRSYFNYGIYRMAGRYQEAQRFLDDFVARMPFPEPPPEPSPPSTLSGWEE